MKPSKTKGIYIALLQGFACGILLTFISQINFAQGYVGGFVILLSFALMVIINPILNVFLLPFTPTYVKRVFYGLLSAVCISIPLILYEILFTSFPLDETISDYVLIIGGIAAYGLIISLWAAISIKRKQPPIPQKGKEQPIPGP